MHIMPAIPQPLRGVSEASLLQILGLTTTLASAPPHPPESVKTQALTTDSSPTASLSIPRGPFVCGRSRISRSDENEAAIISEPTLRRQRCID